MAVDRRRVETVIRAIVHEIKIERVTFLAGSIAYNAFLSLLPLLFLLLAIIAAVGVEGLDGVLIELTQSVITEGAGDVLVAELQAASVGVSAIGIVVLLWGALRIFRSLDMAFSTIYESQAENTLANQIADATIVLVSLTLVVGVGLLVEGRVGASVGGNLRWALERVLLFGVLSLALLPMFYLFPDEDDMQIVEAVPGTLFTAFGFMLLHSLFSIYLSFSSPSVQNSVLASILVFLTWIYFLALVMLVGAAVNAVLTNRSGRIQLEPVIGNHGRGDTTPRSGTDASTPQFDATILEDLVGRLASTQTLSITVDGEETALPPPDRVDADITTSRVPFFNNTAHVELHWVPDDE